MNVFVLDSNIRKCAKYHNDRHCVKMILESTQILSTVCRSYGMNVGYKATHINHPCVKWCSESLTNWIWLRNLVKHLNDEWKLRFNHIKNHKSYDVAMSLPTPPIDIFELTPFALAMPDKYRSGDAVQSYRNY
jgi:hypothetical protein